MRTIAIVGAGFSGTATAAHLLRCAREPLRIVLIDDRPDVAGGLAYCAGQEDFLLNVPAGQLSLDPSRPGEFVDFAAREGARAAAEDFLPRTLYGRYLRASLRKLIDSADGIECARIWGRASCLTQLRDRAHSFRVDLEDGHVVFADEVVLATGNPVPARLPPLQAVSGTSWYVHDPWSSPPDELAGWTPRRVMLLGTGLTMVDVALRLARKGPVALEMLALSRHGRLPRRQTVFDRSAVLPDAVVMIRNAGGSLRELVRVVRTLARQADAAGGDWREVVNAVRRIVPELWARLSLADQRRFLRHVRPIWDIHRHRLPPAVRDELERLRAAGRLVVRAGTLESATITNGAIEVTWRPRGATAREQCIVGRIFNCTGPDYRAARSENVLIRSLLGSGLITPDPLELGIRTTAESEVIGAAGHIVEGLYYIGPWLRARDWEATAVSELREHARRLAERLADAPVNRRRQESVSGRWRLALAGRAALY